jgi:hypothetical protein
MTSSRIAFLLAALALAGCQTQVKDTSTPVMAEGTATIAAPRRVLVYPLAVDPAVVQLDTSPLIARQRAAAHMSAAVQQTQDAAAVQLAIADTLVAQFQSMGLAAERASTGAATRPGDMLVGGRITAVNEGNRVRRVGVGLGVGKSQVLAEVTVATVLDNGQRLPLKTYTADANSGRAPGMGASLGIGAATSTMLESAVVGSLGEVRMERKRNPVADEGERLAKRVGYALGQYFVEQGWIAKDKAPSRFR